MGALLLRSIVTVGCVALATVQAGAQSSPSRQLQLADIAVGTEHVCVLTTTGTVLCWWENYGGQLGDGTTKGRRTSAPVVGLTSEVVSLEARDDTNCALTTGGGLYCWGRSDGGMLGDGTKNDRHVPTPVSGLQSGVTSFSMGYDYVCAVTAVGGLWCWGGNTYGQLGDGTSKGRLTPMQVTGLDKGVSAVAASGSHTCAVTKNGSVFCWGWNVEAALGNGTRERQHGPGQVSGLDGGVTAVALGANHSCALTTAGGVLCWGRNNAGQLGDGTTTRRLTPTRVIGLEKGVTAIAANYDLTCALTAAGGVLCWGVNGVIWPGQSRHLTPTPMAPFYQSGVKAIAVVDALAVCVLKVDGGSSCAGTRWADAVLAPTYGQNGAR
jgi:alpha-tubulin suppressor-like RCC1 family protein